MAEEQKTSFQTRLLLHKTGKSANDRLLFGWPVSSTNHSNSTALNVFETGQIFGFVRWRGDGYGTQTWRVCVAEAGAPGEELTRIPGIDPGAHLLLHAFGKMRAKRALRAIDGLAERHVLHEIAPAFWRHAHLQVSRNLPFESYDTEMFKRLDAARSAS